MQHFRLTSAAALVALLGLNPAAHAQSTTTPAAGTGYDGTGWFARPTGTSRSLLPFTSEGYVGGSIGRSNYHLSNCAPGFRCDDNKLGLKVYTGGQLFRIAGAELAYVHLGSADRSGGRTRAQGVNLSAVMNVPAGPLNAFAKVGSTYGFTRTTGTAPGFRTGRENGFGLSYGAGLRFDIGRDWGIRAEWDRMNFKYRDGRDPADLFSIGAVYRFN